MGPLIFSLFLYSLVINVCPNSTVDSQLNMQMTISSEHQPTSAACDYADTAVFCKHCPKSHFYFGSVLTC